MKTILVLGAGRSSSSLIAYLLKNAGPNGWSIIVGDASLEQARQKVGSHFCGQAVQFNIENENDVLQIGQADVVISLLPPPFHPIVALNCLKYKKHLLTASYVSEEMKAFESEVIENGLSFINECGLDPGIDHMSAMKVIDTIKGVGGELTTFESFTGGLIAPETDPSNPWRYKFTWNPRNVVMAGQGTAKYLKGNEYKYIPYQQLFKRITPVHVPGLGDFEGYANRDSLKYIDTYQLGHVQTMLRGTLRNKGFCAAWNVLVQLGCCDDSFKIENARAMTHLEFLSSFLPTSASENVEDALRAMPGLITGNEIDILRWSGFFDKTSIGITEGTPAQLLEHILNKKWKMNDHDKDQIVMWHRFGYNLNGEQKEIQAALVATGNDAIDTAMAQTVGLPLGIACKLLLQGKITSRGVLIPTTPEFYEPILRELKTLNIELTEWEVKQ